MRHRGPDETGTWADGEVVFGFNRLSIIDLEHSHQPLSWGPPESPNRYTLVFNGEIYNYLELRAELIEKFDAQFNTDGDGEVIVAAYHYLGEASVSRLRGMFAFLIWDSERRVVFGARDPFGIKPLFYASGPGGVAFASEKKSLLDLAPQLGITPALDTTALQHYLILQYVPEPESLQQTIRRIESGNSFTITPGGKPVTRRYFNPIFRRRLVKGPADSARLYDDILAVMRDSVAKHMRADVTVGAFLSGGIDSTAIAALAKEHNPDLITFTTGFERKGYSEIDVDEQYNVIVLEDAIPKPVISGGEEDLANLVLRLAISEMIAERAGQPFSLLILDEVFGSLDETRRHNVVDLLRRLQDRFEQVILITHIDTVREGLDRVVAVRYDEETGTSRVAMETGGERNVLEDSQLDLQAGAAD